MFGKQQLLDSPKLKEFADNNFRIDENGKKSSKRAENMVGKGEIACCKQFLLFPQCFQKTCATDMGLFGEGLTSQYEVLSIKRYEALENIERAGENAAQDNFLLFLQCFLTHQ